MIYQIAMLAGTKSQILLLRLNRTGLKCSSRTLKATFHRCEEDPAPFPLVSMDLGVYVSGGFIEVDRKNMPCIYQLGIPDEALAAGVDFCVVSINPGRGDDPVEIRIELVPAAVPEDEFDTFPDSDPTHTLTGAIDQANYVLHEGTGRPEGLINLEDLRILKEAATAANKISEDDFNEWMTDRWNEYSKAGIDRDSRGIEEFIKDFKEKFPEGVKIL